MFNNDTWFDPAYARVTFRPITNNALDLGTSSLLFRNAFVNNIYASSNLKLGVNSTEWINVNTSGDLTFLSNNGRLQTSTSDGSDNKGLFFCGGGSNTVGRGAVFFAGGNEYSGFGGLASVSAGDASSAYVIITAPSATNPTIRFQLTSTEQWRMSGTSFIGYDATSSSIYRVNNTGSLLFSGGTNNSTSNGAVIEIYGVSSAGVGSIYFYTGNNSSGHIYYGVTHASALHRFLIGGSEKVRFNSSGIVLYNGTGMGIYRENDTGYTFLAGGTAIAVANGAYMIAYGNSHASLAGRMYLYSGSASGLMIFQMGLSTGSFAFKDDAGTNLISFSKAQCYLNVATGGDFSFRVNNTQIMSLSVTGLRLPSLADGTAGNDTWYYSTTQNKACYKDSSGVSNALY